MYLFIYLSFYLSTYLSIHLSIYLSICLPTCVPVSESIFLAVCLFVSLSVYLSIYLFIYLFVYIYIYIYIYILPSLFSFSSLSPLLRKKAKLILSKEGRLDWLTCCEASKRKTCPITDSLMENFRFSFSCVQLLTRRRKRMGNR